MMNNFILDSLNQNNYHKYKMGDNMTKKYGNKEVKFTIFFDNEGESLEKILEQCYKDEIRNESILTGGKKNELHES